MPYTIDNPPDMWANYPAEMQRILISTFNQVYRDSINKMEQRKAEIKALRIAWSAAKEKYVKKDGEWVARTQNNVNESKSDNMQMAVMKCNRFEPVRSYEDDHFVGYNICLTTRGVMNGAFKPADEIRKIPGNLPEEYVELLPNVDDHPDDEVYIPPGQEDTFVTNIRVEDDEDFPKCMGTVLISKDDEWKINAIETGALIESSIGYSFNLDPTDGIDNGRPYSHIERNIKLYHNAFMVTQYPACTPEMGCGINETFECECIECGYEMTSNQHCSELKCPECGGQMRRVNRPGPGQPKSDGIKDDDVNELSHDDIREYLRSLLPETETGYYWIIDVFDDHFVFEVSKRGGDVASGYVTYDQSYEINDKDIITIVGEPRIVHRRTEYFETGESMDEEENIESPEDNENPTDEDVDTENTEAENDDNPVEEETEEQEDIEENTEEESEDNPVEENEGDELTAECQHIAIMADLKAQINALKIKADLWDEHCAKERSNAINRLKAFKPDISDDTIADMPVIAINMIVEAYESKGENDEQDVNPVNLGEQSNNDTKSRLPYGYWNQKGEWIE